MSLPISLNNLFELDKVQEKQFESLDAIYREWNGKVNLISRKDIDNLYLHHVLHSLAIAKVLSFVNNTTILDVGTGGGFPGIPLAILFPYCQFVLIDSIEKKIKAVMDIVSQVKLSNVECRRERAEEEKEKFDFIVSRAAMSMSNLHRLCQKNVSDKHKNAMPNGFFILKGGNINAEIEPFKNISEVFPIQNLFDDSRFDDKYVIYVPSSTNLRKKK